MAVDERTERVFVLNGDGHVSVLDAVTGAPRRTIASKPGTPVAEAVDVRNGRLFVASGSTVDQSGSVRLINMATGADVGTTTVSHAPTAVAVDGRTGRIFVLENQDPPAPGSLDVLDAATGKILSTYSLSEPANALAIDERASRVLIGLSYGRRTASMVDVRDAATGADLRTHAFEGYANTAIVVDAMDARVFFVTTPTGYDAEAGGGEVLMSIYDTRRGRVLRTLTLARVGAHGNAIGAAAILDQNISRVFITIQEGSVAKSGALVAPGRIVVLDARSGRIVRRLSGQVGDTGLVADEQTNHLFICNRLSNTVSMFDAATVGMDLTPRRAPASSAAPLPSARRHLGA